MPQDKRNVNFTYIPFSKFAQLSEVDSNTLYFVQSTESNTRGSADPSYPNMIVAGEHIVGMDIPYGDGLEYGATEVHSYAIYSGTNLIFFNSIEVYQDDTNITLSKNGQPVISGTVFTLPEKGISSDIDTNYPTWQSYSEIKDTVVSIYTDSFDSSIGNRITVPGNMNGWFSDFDVLSDADLQDLDVSEVNQMLGLFLNCENLRTVILKGWDTSEVSLMRNMFYNCSSVTTISVSDTWTTESIADTASGEGMFYNCIHLPNFDPTQVSVNKAYYGGDGLGYLDDNDPIQINV